MCIRVFDIIGRALFFTGFSIIFGFAVGFTAYNFGALVRYKIPCLPTVGILLAALYSLRAEKNDKEESLQH